MYDLLAEDILQAPPSERNRDRLWPLLERVAAESASREGGVAAFVILALAWALNGYPAAMVERTLRRLPSASRVPLELLEAVQELLQLEEAEVAAALATALREGRIPAVVAALVHQRRLLWRPDELPELGAAYQAARQFLGTAGATWPTPAETLDELADRHIDKLASGARALDAAPPAPVPDASDEPADVAERVARVGRLADDIEGLAEQLKHQRGRLRALGNGPLSDAARAEVGRAQAMLGSIDRHVAAGLAQLASVREEGAGKVAADVDRMEQRLRTTVSKLGAMRKLLAKLDPAGPPPQAAGPEQEDHAPPPPVRHGLQGLRDAVDEVDRRLAERFAAATASFDAYRPDLLHLAPLRSLWALVHDRQAQALYRLGHRRQARTLWCQLLDNDPLRPAIARNIAVADTCGPDRARHMASWRAYTQSLYAHAILAGNPRVLAEERGMLHGALGGAYAPRRVVTAATVNPTEADGPAVAAFLGSRSRLRAFTRHKLLELLAGKLDFASPALLLGVAREDGEDQRTRAREDLLAFATTACEALPRQVRDGFLRLASDNVESAFAASHAVEQRTLAMDSSYINERERQLTWLRTVLDLKDRLDRLVREHLVLVSRLETLAFLDELAVLDRVPVTSSPTLLPLARTGPEARNDPQALQTMLKRLGAEIVDLLPRLPRTWPSRQS
jgi:hypothetical protein